MTASDWIKKLNNEGSGDVGWHRASVGVGEINEIIASTLKEAADIAWSRKIPQNIHDCSYYHNMACQVISNDILELRKQYETPA